MNHHFNISIIDDHPEARNALQALLEAHRFQVFCYENPLDFFDQFDPNENLCVITDYKMNQMDGLEVVQTIRKIDDQFPVIVISAFANVNTAVNIMKSGAHTLIQKPYEASHLLQAIDEISYLRGQKKKTRSKNSTNSSFDALTDEELAILQRMIEGKPTKAIAMDLDISTRTVDRRRSSINKKLGTHSLAELAMTYVDWMNQHKMTTRK